ncbi:MAG: hypothetical protein LIO71_02600 [Ruminococcus sp.]|nr:hypothetical protein [Ruminococcus sp.]
MDIAKYIHIDDAQLQVYSMKIADLLTIVCTQIEAISKELYFQNGGTKTRDDKPDFDYVCLKYLSEKWDIDKKVVLVSCPSLYLLKQENIELKPLHKVFRQDKPLWKKAYNNIKHDRLATLKSGNIKNLLSAMAALYLLNLYHNDATYHTLDRNAQDISQRFGSQIFSVKVWPCSAGVSKFGVVFRNPDFPKYTYITKIEDEVWEKIWGLGMKIQEDGENKIIKLFMDSYPPLEPLKHNPEVKNLDLEKLKEAWIEFHKKMKGKIMASAELGKEYMDTYKTLKYEVVLNKNQFKSEA